MKIMNSRNKLLNWKQKLTINKSYSAAIHIFVVQPFLLYDGRELRSNVVIRIHQ